MNSQGASILGSIKKMIAIVMVAIILLLLSFIYLYYQSGKKEYEDKIIINVFGKQRMYTQMISKDAMNMYGSLLALITNMNYESLEKNNQVVNQMKENIQHAQSDFSDTLASIHRGYLKLNSEMIPIQISDPKAVESLEKIDALWLEFEDSIETLTNANQLSEMAPAVIYITEHNMELMELCDDLLTSLLDSSIATARATEYVAYGLVGLLMIVIILALLQLRTFIILPFGQLYKGIYEIGLLNHSEDKKIPTRQKVMPIISEINDMFRKINYLISLIENMNNSASFMETMNFINQSFSTFVPYNFIGIALIEDDKKKLRASYGVSDGTVKGLPDKLLGASWRICDTSLGSLINSGEGRIINDLEEYTAGKPIKPYNAAILEAGIKSSITLPLKVSGEPVGVIFFSSTGKNAYNEEHLKFLKTLVNSIAISLNQNIFINDILYSSVLALAKLAETRDEETGDHLERMKCYSKIITELLYEANVYTDEINLDYIERIERYSPLHDIGKVGIRDGILLKPGKLTTEEFNEMKQHTTFGAKVLRSSEENLCKRGKSMFSLGIEIAEAHHEKWDGSGYPMGMKETEIPLSARIVAIADVFDALTSKRPYKEAFPIEDAFRIIEEGRCNHFDPKIVDVFLANRSKIHRIYDKFHDRNLSS